MDLGGKVGKMRTKSRKIIPLVITILVLMAVAFATGYYLSVVRFDQKYTQLEEREKKAEEEANRLELIGNLVRAKGEVIAGKIALLEGNVEKSILLLDASIAALKGAYEKADEETKNIIEDFRLRLATVKGFIEVDSSKAQAQLDEIWREIDSLIEKQWKSREEALESQ